MRAMVGLFTVSIFAIPIILSVYYFLGKLAYRSDVYGLKSVFLRTTFLALPLPLIFIVSYFFIPDSSYDILQTLTATLVLYVFIFICFFSGASVQWWMISKASRKP